MQHVAERAGVSTATVSRCLNGSDAVKPQTRARINAAIRALGYTPNFSARALASNRTGVMGVVIPTMENAIFARGLQAMEETLAQRNITLLVATSNYDPLRELEKIRALLARGVDGLALIGFARPPEAYQLIAARGLPYAVMWNYAPDSPHPCVGFDNEAAARRMTDCVLAHGHRRIGAIMGRTGNNDRAAARIAGVRAALGERGLALAPEALRQCAYSLRAGEEEAGFLLDAPTPPSAIICGNDVLAAGALRAARRRGLDVPADLSIVGFDDIDIAAILEPGLTTMRAPHRRMGESAAQMLMALAQEGGGEKRICFETELVQRGSLGPAP